MRKLHEVLAEVMRFHVYWSTESTEPFMCIAAYIALQAKRVDRIEVIRLIDHIDGVLAELSHGRGAATLGIALDKDPDLNAEELKAWWEEHLRELQEQDR